MSKVAENCEQCPEYNKPRPDAACAGCDNDVLAVLKSQATKDAKPPKIKLQRNEVYALGRLAGLLEAKAACEPLDLACVARIQTLIDISQAPNAKPASRPCRYQWRPGMFIDPLVSRPRVVTPCSLLDGHEGPCSFPIEGDEPYLHTCED